MAKFLVLGYGGQRAESEQEGKVQMGRWMAWFEWLADGLVDMGAPFGERAVVGDVPAGLAANGYCMVAAPSLEAAKEMVSRSPAAQDGQGLEIIELTEMGPKKEE